MASEHWPFTGRSGVLEHVDAAVASANGLLIAGAVGVGKSRLAAECAARAERDGFTVVRVQATRAARRIPLGALAPLLPDGSYPDGLRGDTLARIAAAIGSGPRSLLVVDDADLLDDASAAVVHQIAVRRLAVAVLTMRSGPGSCPPDTMLALWKDGVLDRLDLEPLTRACADELLGSALGGPVDGACLRDLWEASHGNPLYLRELVQGALETGTLRHAEGLWQLTRELPTSVRLGELVDARLTDLRPEARRLLELLALGEPLEPPLLARLADLDVLHELEERGLATAGETGAVQLGHPLHGEVLRHRMTTATRMSVSRQLASAARDAGGPARPDAELRTAIWQLDSGGRVDPELTLRAARQAYFAHDTRVAQRLAGAAYDAGAGIPAGLLLAEVLGDRGRQPERLHLLRRLSQRATGDREVALVAMDRAYATFWGLGLADEARGCLAEAERRVPPGEWHDELTAQRAVIALLSGELATAIGLAMEVLDRNDGGRPVVKAALALAPALAIAGRCDEAVAIAGRGLATQMSLGDQEVMSDPGVHIAAQAVAYGQSGRLAEAAAILTAGYRSALARRARSGQSWCAMQRANVAVLTGRLGTAQTLYAEGAAGYADLGVPGLRRWCIAGQALAAGQQGDAETATAAVAELDRLPAGPFLMMESEVLRARAWATIASGDLAAGRRGLRDAIRWATASGAHALATTAWHDLVRLGDPADAAPAAEALTDLLSRVDGPLAAARELHARGAVAQDPGLLTVAGDRFAALGAELYAAEVFALAAAVYRRQHRSRRADGLAARAHGLAAQCESARTPALELAGPAAVLTAREREVAALAAQGLSSKEIADQFTLSVRTVDSHLLRTYTKLGVAGRAELAKALAQVSLN